MIHLIKPADVPHAIAAVRGELSQRKLATLTGFGQSQIADWETGGRQPGLGSLMRLCAVRPWELALLPRQQETATGPYVHEITKAIEKHLRISGYTRGTVEWDGAMAAARAFAEREGRR